MTHLKLPPDAPAYSVPVSNGRGSISWLPIDVALAASPAAMTSATAPADRGNWAPAVSYAPLDVARAEGHEWICVSAHTSGNIFAERTTGGTPLWSWWAQNDPTAPVPSWAS